MGLAGTYFSDVLTQTRIHLRRFKGRLPPFATLLGVTLSSDKTRLSAMTGDRVAHPLLITLANIDSALRLSSSSHAIPLLALFPVPKFVNVKKGLNGVLENRLIHACLDFITNPLKAASKTGTWLSDYAGKTRYCFTPLVAYIVDTPEATALTGVAGKTSHLTMATYKEFGDSIRHPPRTATSILTSLDTLASEFDPDEVAVYTKHAKTMFRLNGVHLPFWRDWNLPDGTLLSPHQFFPIEILHHLHKSFWDHDVKWTIRAIGDFELDLRFSLIQPRNGYRQFSAGISSLKQVTGREHRDIQRYLLALIPDYVDVRFVLCIRALLDLRYLSQLHQATEHDLHAISSALELFHTYKQVIIDLGLRPGKAGPLTHFEIPKLELLQSIVSCIQWSGTLPQWSADVTERLHIDYIKTPRENTNGRDYPPQICRNLDRQEKCRLFDLATKLQEAISAEPDLAGPDDDPDWIFDTQPDDKDWKSELPDIAQAFGPRATTDLFAVAKYEQSQPNPPPFPRTFATPVTAFHLNHRADISRSTVGTISIKYEIPDLLQATRDFFSHFLHDQSTRTLGGRRGPAWNATLPFEHVRVWSSVRVQTYSQLRSGLAPPEKLFASPPSTEWPKGRFDTAIFAQDAVDGPLHPPPGLNGKQPHYILFNITESQLGFFVGQIRLIFHPIWDLKTKLPLYLAYVERFDIVPQGRLPREHRLAPDPIRGMYVLRRAYQSDGSPMGSIIPLYHLRRSLQLVPRYGEKADPTLTPRTSFSASRDFYLNHYFDKEDFFYMRDSLDT